MKKEFISGMKFTVLALTAIFLSLAYLLVALVLPPMLYKEHITSGNVMQVFPDNNAAIYQYERIDNHFIAIDNDPYLIIKDIDKDIGAVILKFSKKLSNDLNVQIFYASTNSAFSENFSSSVKGKSGTKEIVVDIPVGNYASIRLDIGDKSGIDFYLEKIVLSDINQKISSFTPPIVTVLKTVLAIGILCFLLAIASLFIESKTFRRTAIYPKLLSYNESNRWNVIFFLILTAIFFCLMPVITYDSVWYHDYLKFFYGESPLSEWNTIRGLPFPLLLYISTKLFGYTPQGITITMYLFYSLSLVFIYKIVSVLEYRKSLGRLGVWLLLTVLIFLNPIYIGYYHTVLTEFVAASITAGAFYFIYSSHLQLIKAEKIGWKIHLKRILIVALLAVLIYLVKQMYIFCVLLPYLGSELLLLIDRFSFKRLIMPIVTCFLSVVLLLIFTSCWYGIVDAKDSLYTKDSDLATSAFRGGTRYFVTDSLADLEEGETIIVKVMDNKQEVIKKFDFIYEKSLWNSVKFLFECLVQSPSRFLAGYIDNYFVVSNLYAIEDPFSGYAYNQLLYNFSFIRGSENDGIACINQYLYRGMNLYRWSGFQDLGFYGIQQYDQEFDSSFFSRLLYRKEYKGLGFFLYSFGAFIALPLLLLSLALFIRNKVKKYPTGMMHQCNFLLSFTVFFHILFLAATGCNIDRYAFPVYLFCVLIVVNIFIITIRLIKRGSKQLESHRIRKET